MVICAPGKQWDEQIKKLKEQKKQQGCKRKRQEYGSRGRGGGWSNEQRHKEERKKRETSSHFLSSLHTVSTTKRLVPQSFTQRNARNAETVFHFFPSLSSFFAHPSLGALFFFFVLVLCCISFYLAKNFLCTPLVKMTPSPSVFCLYFYYFQYNTEDTEIITEQI